VEIGTRGPLLPACVVTGGAQLGNVGGLRRRPIVSLAEMGPWILHAKVLLGFTGLLGPPSEPTSASGRDSDLLFSKRRQF